MDRGFVRIWRKMGESEVFASGLELAGMAVWVLLHVTHTPLRRHGLWICCGQMVTSWERVSESTGATRKQARTMFSKLREAGFLKWAQLGRVGIIVTVCNWPIYQACTCMDGQAKGRQRAGKGQVKGRQRAGITRTEEQENNTLTARAHEGADDTAHPVPEWTAAEYAADIRSLRPEYAVIPDDAILPALAVEKDCDARCQAYSDWRTADLGSLHADERPVKTLMGYLRNARRFGPGMQALCPHAETPSIDVLNLPEVVGGSSN